ncbi:MAG: helix-turn-helix domain-containing protein [Deltaproteobacteria bacterium]|nr:helix-turn-helix domain-containing protein [Deltaproteobacteria bacterium]
MTSRPPARRRRTAEEARHEILAAAQRRLAEGGPEAVRLQDIARDLGIAHPTILHHFATREGLLVALARSAIGALNDDILHAITAPQPGTTAAVLDRIFETLGESGHARLLAWTAMSERTPRSDGAPPSLRMLTDALHRRLTADAEAERRPAPARDEVVFSVRLVAAAMLGDALMGDVLNRLSGHADGGAHQRRFRRWLGDLLETRFAPSAPAKRRRRRR